MSEYHKLSEFDLIAFLSKGDERAYKEIYDRYNSLLLIYAFRKLQDKEEAKDVVQEVLTALWVNRAEFVVKTSLSGYLYKAVLNKILNIFRHNDIRRQHIAFSEIIIDSVDSDYRIREKEILAIINKEIENLPSRMREVFELRRKEYLSNKEIAERLQLSEHTVATQIKKSLRILRERFGRLLTVWFF